MFAENTSWQIHKKFGEGRSAWVRPEGKNKGMCGNHASMLLGSRVRAFAFIKKICYNKSEKQKFIHKNFTFDIRKNLTTRKRKTYSDFIVIT